MRKLKLGFASVSVIVPCPGTEDFLKKAHLRSDSRSVFVLVLVYEHEPRTRTTTI